MNIRKRYSGILLIRGNAQFASIKTKVQQNLVKTDDGALSVNWPSFSGITPVLKKSESNFPAHYRTSVKQNKHMNY